MPETITGSCGSGSNAAEDGGDGDDAVSVVEQLLRDGFRAEAAEVPALDRGDFMPPQAASAAPVLLMDDLGMASDNSRVGSCDLQDPVWAKMNALTGIKQKRKKSDNKPQTQINKCNNEKRRREQENIYIEELAELISANFADMSSLSVKPDKCAILQETVNQIRRIKQQDTANQQIVDPVQQGEVSSSRPTILSNEVYGPLLLEALEGFLFVINSEGKVEHVTDNVVNYIKHTKDEIIGKTIYNFMHPGDHTKFHSNLLPMTIEWGSDQPRSKSIDVRLLVKASDDLDETVEEKTQRVPCYELMHISSTQLRGHLSVSEDDGSDNGPCLLCVASRISHRDKASCFFEQFTTKLDTNGKITCVDTSGVSEAVSQVLRKDFKGRLLRDLVPQQDVHKVTAHLKETLSSGTSVSAVYRIQVAPDKLVSVQTKSKFFKTNPHVNNSEITDFIMATHSIIGDNDSLDPGGGIGGPLMTSIVNGGAPRNGPSNNRDTAPPSSSALIPHASTAGTFTSEFLENDFSTLDFHSTTWELEPSWPDAAKSNSRQSVTPVSTPTPRPPSNPSYSNAPTVVQSPMGHYSAQPSPANQQPTNQNNSNFMPFGIIDDFQEQHVFNVEKDTKVLDETPSHAEPQRLRSLLTNPPTSNASSSSNSNSQQDENRDRILKELLNQQDDEQNGRVDGRNNNSRVMLRGPVAEPPKNIASSSTGNDMLRKLLNDKNDDDDIETKAGMKKSSELLQQLLKKESNEDDEKKNENGPHEDVLLKTLGFPTGSSNSSGNKRSMEDNKDDRGSKRMNNGLQSSSNSSEKSEIYQKNKMLASLLENPTPTPPSIPPIPASVISATPQEKLPRVISDPAKLIPVTMNQGNMRPRMNARQQQATFHRQGAANPPNFIDHIWIENNNDPVLSAILDDFIDFVPDRNILLSENNEGQPTNSFHLSESAAINNIQKILMEVEDSVTSPNVSLPARPPAYSSNNNLVYPPPPNYHQVKYPKAMGVRAGVPQYANPQQQLLLEQQRKIQQREAEEQKRRLLQQQEQQQLVILSNNASAGINPTQTFDSLLNNTVAPNVTLQRSSSLPESQLSPGYSNQLQSSNSLSQTNQRGVVPQSNRQQQQPYSPHSQLPSPLGQQNFQTQTTATGNYSQQQRLSPQSQFNPQLSPRQTYTTQGNGNAAGNWSQQQQQQRLTVQNPMLNAQLTGALTGRGNFQRPPSAQQGQQQRALNSPGGATRHSPFGGDQFAPPSSPTAAFNQNQYLQRLQRANSVPTSSSQMTGGLGSPRPYSGNNQAPPHYPPTHLQSIPSNPMLYTAPQTPIQQDSPYNCYDQQQQTQQPILNVYERRASAPVPHLQPGVASSNPTSEFVRQELRAVVGARTAQAQPGQRSGPTSAQQLQQQLNQSGTVDLESLGLTFEMASGASESPKLWAAMGSDMGSMSPQPATSRNTMEEGRPGDHTKTSLLQQLLSDQSK